MRYSWNDCQHCAEFFKQVLNLHKANAGTMQLHKLDPRTHKLDCTNQFVQCVCTVLLSMYGSLMR